MSPGLDLMTTVSCPNFIYMFKILTWSLRRAFTRLRIRAWGLSTASL